MEILQLKFSYFFAIYLAFVLINVGRKEPVSVVDCQRIGGDLISTLRIVARLCFNPMYHTSSVARRFFGCYDEAPGKPEFVRCQKRSFGNVLNTIPRIDTSCRNPATPIVLARYQRCLQQEFRKSGINMDNAVTQINRCQGRVLGF